MVKYHMPLIEFIFESLKKILLQLKVPLKPEIYGILLIHQVIL